MNEMQPEELDRGQERAIKVHKGDRLYLWDPPFGEKQNLTIQANTGNNVFTVYGITNDQLASLYLEIAMALGKPPEPTVHHLRQIHDTVGRLIQAAEPIEAEDPFGDFADDERV